MTKKQHDIVTANWRKIIGYSNQNVALKTYNATNTQIKEVAQLIYKDHPDILRALDLLDDSGNLISDVNKIRRMLRLALMQDDPYFYNDPFLKQCVEPNGFTSIY